jgi:hypothetical protein|tara:strand:- start:38 stop:373 length:336 start_codon:yes stop_codon:yes gene_type:complete
MAVDMVNHPPHYTSTKYEVIDILEEFFKDDPLLWQCGKYLLRCKGKGNLEQDLSKMIWYAKRRMEREELIKNGETENIEKHIDETQRKIASEDLADEILNGKYCVGGNCED